MKILATADLHIRDYQTHVHSMDGPLPDRLSIYYQQVAVDIVETVEREGCEVIIFAGDTLDAPVNQPLVLTSLGRFRDIVTRSGIPILCCHGQHDLATKVVDGYVEYQTVLPIFQNEYFYYFHDKLVYFEPGSAPRILNSQKDIPKKAKGITIYFYGWDRDPCKTLVKADMFVGHHLINSAVETGGYMFYQGYDPKILGSTYKFSVLGDIHNSQHFGNNVLIPGVPIQNKFNDNPVCGVWVIDTDTWEDKFIEFNAVAYPKYYMVKQEEDIPKTHPIHHHYRLASKVHSEGAARMISVDIDKIDLWKITSDIIDKLDNKDLTPTKRAELKSLAEDLFESLKTKSFVTKSLPTVVPERLIIKDFISIKEAEFKFPEGLTLISGDIGSGKSSLLEAIPYALYGRCAKMDFKDDVRPSTYRGETEVILEFSVDGTHYRVVRGVGKVKFYTNVAEDDEGTEISGTSIADTDRKIEEKVQLGYSEFCSMVHFSQGVHSFFKHVSDADKTTLMNLFLGSTANRVAALTEASVAGRKHHQEKMTKLTGAIEAAEGLKKSYEAALENEIAKQITIEQQQTNELIAAGYSDVSEEIVALMVSGLDTKAVNRYFGFDLETQRKKRETSRNIRDDLRTRYNEGRSSYDSDKHSLKSLEGDISRLNETVRAYKKGMCPSCKRPLPVDKAILKKYVNELQQKQAEAKVLETSLSNGRLADLEKLNADYQVVGQKLSVLDQTLEAADQFLACKVEQLDRTNEIKRLQQNIKDQGQIINENTNKFSSHKDKHKAYNYLASHVFADKGVTAKCIESVGDMMSAYINRLFEDVGLECSVTISTKNEYKNTKSKPGFRIEAFFQGTRTTYHMASGGQRMLLDLASISAIYNLLSDTYNLSGGIMSMLVLDEFVNYLDEENVEVVADLLDSFNAKSLYLVSHDSKMKQLACAQTVRVHRRNGISHYSM